MKPGTLITYGRCRSWLVDFFGEDRPIDQITEGDADEWAVHLRKTLADNTARKMASIAKQLFRHATRKRLIASNPFSDLASNVRQNSGRDYTVTREEFNAVVAVVGDAEWRLILALSRFGGLRVPSEIFALKWGDVDLNKGRFLIHSPKTEHHPDGASRVCPIFPELRPYFEEALLDASDGSGRVPGSQHVVATHRTPVRESRDAVPPVHRESKTHPVAEVVAQHAGHATNGTRKRVADARRLQVARQLTEGCRFALSARDRRTLRVGKWRCAMRCKSRLCGAEHNGTEPDPAELRNAFRPHKTQGNQRFANKKRGFREDAENPAKWSQQDLNL